jgi:chromosome segregation ATPase
MLLHHRRVAPATANETTTTTIAALRAENASLVMSLAALHVRFGALQRENERLLAAVSSPQEVVVHSLCARIVELTASEEAMQRKAQRLKHRLDTLREKCAKEAEDLREQVRQLQGGIAAVQDANDGKATELCRLKRDVARIKEHLTCSISQEIMQRVCILSTGQAYNYDSITKWLWRSGSNRCPNTGLNVQEHDYQPATSPALNEVCAIVAKM